MLRDCLISPARVVEVSFPVQIVVFESSNTWRVLRNEEMRFERKNTKI
jgi:hypothetical protein